MVSKMSENEVKMIDPLTSVVIAAGVKVVGDVIGKVIDNIWTQPQAHHSFLG